MYARWSKFADYFVKRSANAHIKAMQRPPLPPFQAVRHHLFLSSCDEGRNYNSQAVKPPELYYQAGKASDFVLERCPSLLKPYRPTYWATNGHVQSALGGANLPTCTWDVLFRSEAVDFEFTSA